MDTVAEKLVSFVFGITSFVVALGICVVPAWKQEDFATAAIGFISALLIFRVAPIAARAIGGLRGPRARRSKKFPES